MEILIKLDKRLYEYVKHHTLTFGEIDEICDAITNGVQLPKGHGRLIDADAYRKEMLDSREFDFFKRLDMQPTIIEADKEE